ncbi:MAG TPA: tetratricopeptide repeat protein [Vicinamibacterales bacterium]|nr:tetratricopeptide repeat protein [Vicinamibacterales bacterium]
MRLGISAVVLAAFLAGCAARSPQTVPARGSDRQAPAGTDAGAESLSTFMAKVRYLSTRPVKRAGETLEARDAELAADLASLGALPTADAHWRVAERYRQRGVLDMAYRHFNRALALDPRHAPAYEGLARVWRDWRLPHLGVADAHRATYYAPASASARNTYGTLMQALGRDRDAKLSYELAAMLDPKAAYAFNNLCYLSFLSGRIDAAIESCQTAVALDPTLAAARNNLGLAFAAAGRMDLARTQFLDAGDRAAGLYNTGLVYLAAGDPRQALAAFDAASRERATFALARERATRIRAMLRLPGARATERIDGAPGQHP